MSGTQKRLRVGSHVNLADFHRDVDACQETLAQSVACLDELSNMNFGFGSSI